MKRLLLLACLALLPALPAQTTPKCPQTPAGYDKSLWQQAWKLHFDSVVVDGHSDTTSRILDQDFRMERRARDGHMDLPRIFQGGLDAQFYSIYVAASYFGDEDMSSREALEKSKPNASAHRAMAMIDGFYRTVERNGDRMAACFSVADIHRAAGAGKHAALMGIEGGHAIEGKLGLLRIFHRLGVRYMTLTHSNHNHFADSSTNPTPRWRGLNKLGVKVVKEMNRLGMLVDVSHVSDETYYHVMHVTRAPVILSHSSVRKLCGHPRNITDTMLVALQKNGGVVMINFNCGFIDEAFGARHAAWRYQRQLRRNALAKRHGEGTPAFQEALIAMRTKLPPPTRPSLDKLMQHFLHAIKVAGIDHVGLGSDYDGVPCVPKGVDDVTRLPHITYRLLSAGINAKGVRKVLGGNLLRVFGKVESVSRDLAREKPWRNAAGDRQQVPGDRPWIDQARQK